MGKVYCDRLFFERLLEVKNRLCKLVKDDDLVKNDDFDSDTYLKKYWFIKKIFTLNDWVLDNEDIINICKKRNGDMTKQTQDINEEEKGTVEVGKINPELEIFIRKLRKNNVNAVISDKEKIISECKSQPNVEKEFWFGDVLLLGGDKKICETLRKSQKIDCIVIDKDMNIFPDDMGLDIKYETTEKLFQKFIEILSEKEHQKVFVVDKYFLEKIERGNQSTVLKEFEKCRKKIKEGNFIVYCRNANPNSNFESLRKKYGIKFVLVDSIANNQNGKDDEEKMIHDRYLITENTIYISGNSFLYKGLTYIFSIPTVLYYKNLPKNISEKMEECFADK